MICESLQGRILWTILIGSFTSFSITGRLMERLPLEQHVGFASRSCSFDDKHHSALPNTAKLESLHTAAQALCYFSFPAARRTAPPPKLTPFSFLISSVVIRLWAYPDTGSPTPDHNLSSKGCVTTIVGHIALNQPNLVLRATW
jgi:hypothetical protein